jgi:hypothetical protein
MAALAPAVASAASRRRVPAALNRLRGSGIACDDARRNLLADADRGNAGAVGVLSRWALPPGGDRQLVAVLDPERAVLGGGLGWAALGLAFRAAVSSWYQAVVAAALADNAGVIGGAWAAMNPEAVVSETRGPRQRCSGEWQSTSPARPAMPAGCRCHHSTRLQPFFAELGSIDRVFTNRRLGELPMRRSSIRSQLLDPSICDRGPGSASCRRNSGEHLKRAGVETAVRPGAMRRPTLSASAMPGAFPYDRHSIPPDYVPSRSRSARGAAGRLR